MMPGAIGNNAASDGYVVAVWIADAEEHFARTQRHAKIDSSGLKTFFLRGVGYLEKR